MSRLRIYGIARTRAFRVLWIAKELGLDHEHVPLEIGEEGARKADYLAAFGCRAGRVTRGSDRFELVNTVATCGTT